MAAAPSTIQVNYLSRDFASLRDDLINFAKLYHSDVLAYFNDANPDIMYLEMVAYVGDILSYYTDKTFNESFRSTAQARESLFRIATNLGFYNLGSTPSQTQVVFSITVPYVADPSTGVISPDPNYLIALNPNSQLKSDTGVAFTVQEPINFSNPINRTVIPNLDSNNQVINYTIQVSAVATAGTKKIQRFYVSPDLALPFMQITLDDTGITQIVGAVSSPGNVYTAPSDSAFTDPAQAYFQVDDLIKSQIFSEVNPIDPTEISLFAAQTNVVPGNYVDIPQRFIARRDVNDIVTLTFGSGNPDFSAFNNVIQTSVNANTPSLNQILNNTALGSIPPPNSTMFIQYFVGGGVSSNVLVGQLNTITSQTFSPVVGTPNLGILQNVRASLTVGNPVFPAVGGTDVPTIEEVRAEIGYTYAAQDRAVAYQDVVSLVNKMPPQFGQPYRMTYEEIPPRVSNFSQVTNGVNTLLTTLLAQTDTTSRTIAAQNITTFLNQLQNGAAYIPVSGTGSMIVATSTETANILSATPTLWLGEKCRLYIVGIDANGNLTTAYLNSSGVWVFPNNALKTNIANFLAPSRVIGDWIDIVDGNVINFQLNFTIYADKANKQQVLTDCLNALKSYFAVSNWQMNQPIFIANVMTILQQITGVVNVVDIQFVNVFGIDVASGRSYASQQTGRYFNINPIPLDAQNNKFAMTAVNNVILAQPNLIFECKYPDSDIQGSAL